MSRGSVSHAVPSRHHAVGTSRGAQAGPRGSCHAVERGLIFEAFRELREIERTAKSSTKAARRNRSRPRTERTPEEAGTEDGALDNDRPDSDAAPPRPFSDIETWQGG